MRISLQLRNGLVLLMAALAVSCVSTQPAAPGALVKRPIWPLPPDEPRLEYVKSIRGPADIGQSPSVWHRVSNWVTGDTGEAMNLQKPFGVALDETGNLCLTDTGAGAVCYCDFVHKKWKRWEAVDKERFKSPVAVARRDGIFYVADSEWGKVVAFRDNGKKVFEISTPLQRPAGLAVASDALVVADSQAHTIFVFDLQGKLRFQFGTRGAGPGEFNFPTHVGVDGQGHLLITDSMNARIQVFTPDGKFISEIGSSGDTSGHFGRPKGAAADTYGHIYVADAVFNNVQVFDLNGQLLLTLGEAGAEPGQFGLPNGIAIDGTNQIYITDCYNRRVQVLKYIGQP